MKSKSFCNAAKAAKRRMPSVLFSSAELFSLYKQVDREQESLLREILEHFAFNLKRKNALRS
jgi:hypothetical protein